jgi:phosphate starvation-inducible protein PhoH
MSRKKHVASHVHDATTTLSPETKDSKFKVRSNDLREIKPLTINQESFFTNYNSGSKAILMHGVAGSGKTFIALYAAFKELLERNNVYKKIIIVRSAVPSRDIGFLPGDEKEKTDVYMRPYLDICADLFPRFADKAWLRLHEQDLVEFMITSYVRGLTLDDTIIIIDEAQNMTFQELNSIVTRIGHNSRIIFCGDFRQTDLNKKSDMSGIKKFMEIAEQMKSFSTVEFQVEDCVRSGLVKEYLMACLHYEDSLTENIHSHSNRSF